MRESSSPVQTPGMRERAFWQESAPKWRRPKTSSIHFSSSRSTSVSPKRRKNWKPGIALPHVIHNRPNRPNRPAHNPRDRHSLPPFALVLAHLRIADDAKQNRQQRQNHAAHRGDSDDPQHQRRHAIAIARAAAFHVRAFHRERHSTR